jgi:cytidylate kinase
MAVVSINEQLGSRGAELGLLVAKQLGYRFRTSDELVAEGARTYNISPEQLKVADERQPHFWERLTTDLHRVEVFLRAAVLKEMAGDRVVITSRLLTLIMPGLSSGVRVRVLAPFAERVRRTAIEEGLDEANAQRRVHDHDREIRARGQHLFAADIEDPARYTMVLNTGAMPLEALAPPLAACAQEMDRHGNDGISRIRDAAIAAQVRAALLIHPKIGNAQVKVRCAGGAVRLTGSGLVPPWDELVESVARQVQGIASVEVHAEEPPLPPRS